MKRLLLLTIILIFTVSCNIIPFVVKADLSLSFSPNPAYDPYYTSTDGWTWEVYVTIKENMGYSVELGNYGPNGIACKSVLLDENKNTINTSYYYKNDIEEWFGSNTINANSSISHKAYYSIGNINQGYYIETYYGMDELGNIVSCVDTLTLINNTKVKH